MARDDDEQIDSEDESPVTNNKSFDPEKEFMPVIQRLIAAGRMPTLKQFLEAVEKIRPRYHMELTLLRQQEKQLRRRKPD